MECACKDPDIEFTLVKDELSGWILLQRHCNNCGLCANGYGRTVEQAQEEMEKEWKRSIRLQRRKLNLRQKTEKLITAST